MHSFYLDAIRNFEGFTPEASWDYAQFSNGYGTRARYAGEVIDRAEAERRFQSEVASARTIVEKTAGHMDEGTKAALTSLTYNAGTAWIGSGLGDAVRRGDLDAVRGIFVQYNKAGGEVLQGLVNRRTQEAEWIGNPEMVASVGGVSRADADGTSALPPVIAEQDQSARQVADLIRGRRAEATAAPETLVERGPRVERLSLAGAMGNVSSNAMVALIGTDSFTPDRIADIARMAQLDRGSELARSGQEQQGSKTRQV